MSSCFHPCLISRSVLLQALYGFYFQEAFAVVREASKRVLGLRPFDVQLIGTLTTFTLKFPVGIVSPF